MLDRSRYPQCYIDPRSDGLTRGTYLPIDRQPFAVAYRPRSSKIGAKNIRKLLRDRNVLLRFYAAANRNDDFRLSKIDGSLCFLKRRFGCHTNIADGHVHRFDSCTSLFSIVTTKST